MTPVRLTPDLGVKTKDLPSTLTVQAPSGSVGVPTNCEPANTGTVTGNPRSGATTTISGVKVIVIDLGSVYKVGVTVLLSSTYRATAWAAGVVGE